MFRFEDGTNVHEFYQSRYGIECCTYSGTEEDKECRISLTAPYPLDEEGATGILTDYDWFPSEEMLDRKLFVGGLCRLEPGKGDMVRIYSKDEFGKYSYNELINLGFMSDLDTDGLANKRVTEKLDAVADFCANNDISYVKLFKEENEADEFADFLHDEGFVE